MQKQDGNNELDKKGLTNSMIKVNNYYYYYFFFRFNG